MKGRTCISSLSFLLSLSSLLLVNKAEGGNSYYYCSSGNWSTNSGFKNGSCAGAASAVAPTAADDVTISGAGTTVVIDANATCHTLTILNGATISIPGILVSLTVAGDLVINSGGTLVKGGLLSISTLNLAGNLTNNGTCTLGTSTLNKATLCFTGSINTVVSGTGAFTVYDIVLNTGSKTTAVDVQSATFILGINNAGVYNFTFTQGTFMFDANATLNDCHNNGTNTALTIPFNTVLEFDQGTTTLCSSGTSGAVLLSGKLFLNGGTVNIQTGQASNSAFDFRYQVNGGTPQFYATSGIMNIGAGFNASSGTDYIDFNMSGGTITTAANGYSKSVTFQLQNVSGGITVMTGGRVILQDACNASAPDLDMGGGNISPYTVTGGTVQFGNSLTSAGSTYFGIAANPSTVYPNLECQGASVKNVSPYNAGNINLLSLNVNASMTFDISTTNPNVTFTGSNGTFTLNHAGNLVMGTGTFTFSSSTISQLITGTVATTFGNIVINNTGGGVSLGYPATVTGTLTLTNGVLSTTATNLLTLSATASVSGGTATSYVDGPLAKIGGTAFVFPLGNGGNYAPLGISAPPTSTNQITAQYFNTAYANTFSLNAPLVSVSTVEYWTVSETVAGDAIKITLYWKSATNSSILTFDNTLRVAHFNGASWDDIGQSAITGGAAGSVTSNAISSFSPFTFGSTNSVSNPLPVSLLYFTAKANKHRQVDLNWETVSETNNAFFTVERSRDGQGFDYVTRKEGSGNSSSILSYAALDEHPYNGVSYYRLKMTDQDGRDSYSAMAPVAFSDSSFALTIYPNPSAAGSSPLLNVESSGDKEIVVVVEDITGRELYSMVKLVYKDHQNIFALDCMNRLSRGIYFIVSTTDNSIYKRKFIIE